MLAQRCEQPLRGELAPALRRELEHPLRLRRDRQARIARHAFVHGVEGDPERRERGPLILEDALADVVRLDVERTGDCAREDEVLDADGEGKLRGLVARVDEEERGDLQRRLLYF